MTEHFLATMERLADEGKTPVLVSVGGALAGAIAIADPVKAGAAAAIGRLRAAGKRVIILTGDGERTARAIAREVGVDEVSAELLPEEKARRIEELQAAGATVAMVGDGINDAPALALADVGIAMGTGTDVAMEAGDVTLMKGSLEGVVHTLDLSEKTFRNIRQNLVGAFLYNVLGIPIAAGVLYPAFGLLLSPMIAGAAMAFSSVTVVTNANRLRFLKLGGVTG